MHMWGHDCVVNSNRFSCTRLHCCGLNVREPVVSVKHFHLAEKHQSQGQEEILLVVHWAVDEANQKVNLTH